MSITNEIRNILASVQKEAAEVQAALDAPVLDGTPWLLAADMEVGQDTLACLYGQWPDLRTGGCTTGWMAIESVPSNLRGALQMSEQSAGHNSKLLVDQGIKAYTLHTRDFLQARLDYLERRIADLNFILAV